MNNSDYHSHPAISKSGLDLINQAPAKYWYKKLSGQYNPAKKNIDALVTGTAFHSFVLEPEKLENEFRVLPSFSGKGSQARKNEWLEINSHYNIISMETYERVNKMRDSVMAHPFYKTFMEPGGTVEESLFFTNYETGADCKIRPDFRGEYVVDLKSTIDASYNGFLKSVKKFRYDVQGAFYTDGLNECGHFPNGFVFFAVEKEPPYLCQVFYMGNAMHDEGRRKYLKDLEIYVECKTTGHWPGYSQDIELLDYYEKQ
jgi:hypothetical protein